jgi:hypothetical protein
LIFFFFADWRNLSAFGNILFPDLLIFFAPFFSFVAADWRTTDFHDLLGINFTPFFYSPAADIFAVRRLFFAPFFFFDYSFLPPTG